MYTNVFVWVVVKVLLLVLCTAPIHEDNNILQPSVYFAAAC